MYRVQLSATLTKRLPLLLSILKLVFDLINLYLCSYIQTPSYYNKHTMYPIHVYSYIFMTVFIYLASPYNVIYI